MDKMEKQLRILDLLDEVEVPEPMMRYYDYDSDKLLDKKIEVLQQLKAGTLLDDIDGGYAIFELLPKDGHWD